MYEQKEIGDYRISIYQDSDPLCPYEDFSLVGKFIYQSDRWCAGNLDEYGDGGKGIGYALGQIVCDHVSIKAIIKYINESVSDLRFRYDKSDHMWYLERYHEPNIYSPSFHEDGWWEVERYDPCDLKSGNVDACDLVDELDVDDLEYLMENCQKEIAFTTWSSSGYCQGDYVSGFAYCDKKRFIEHCGNMKNWRERAVEFMLEETEQIGMWLWGDVKGYVLEKKVRYEKVYKDEDRDPEEDFDWEEVDSCWGYFLDEDGLIKEVEEEWNISETA